MHLAELESSVPESDSEIIINAKKVVRMEVDAAEEISHLNNLKPIAVDNAVSQTSAIDGNAEKSPLLCYVSRENYKIVLFLISEPRCRILIRRS